MAHTKFKSGSLEHTEAFNELAAAVDAVEAANVGGSLAGKSLVGKPDAGTGVTSAVTASTANTVPLYNGTSIAFGKVPAAALTATDSAKIPGTPAISVAAESAHARAVTITLKDLTGTAMAAACKATVWLSSTSGGAPTGTAPTSTTSVGTGTVLKIVTTDVLHDVLCNASGSIVITYTQSAAVNYFVNVAFGGAPIVSAACNFAG